MRREVMDEDTVTGATEIEELRSYALAPAVLVSAWGAATSIGRIRPENEDAFGHLGQHLFVLADGMGGHAGGRMAATTAVQSVVSTAGTVGVSSLVELVRGVSAQVRVQARARGFDRAGTTLVVVRVLDGVVSIASVGDSRVYRVRGDEMTPLTTDHTVAADIAAVAPGGGRAGTGLHALTRYVGAADGNDVPHVTSLAPQAGERLLMVTDGVFKQLSDAQILAAMEGRSAAQAATELVSLADRAGGRDNATALVLDLDATTGGQETTNV